MTDLSQLFYGSVLMLLGVGLLIASLPRKGKKAWFVGKPFLESGMPILMIATFSLGLILIVAYFTTIDDATLAGAVKHL